MSRPKPKIINSFHQNSQIIEVCESTAIYAVFYQGRPIKIRARPQDMFNGFKYGKSSFPEAGHAIRLAQKLNREFNTNDYTVVELKIGRVVEVGK